ncbi:hemerythrin family protein [Nitrogeniibacter mangrovi]|uniref:Hemerythrin family protein n=1 Tax=Nitrogeniibacter mangrovi TaxID=2016596 RepID=A0A6C1B0G6_9RHOO|nr:hemerythrin family protein [Nitrogeniibacter mangrovi]QID16489.1 hemerythrin family protein [Nitrogeniibacter mangrovi]
MAGVKRMSLESLIAGADALHMGQSRLDADHQRLLALVSRVSRVDLSQLSGDEFAELLSDFADYAYRHFDEERDWMRAIGYPDAAAHEALHDVMVERVGEICMAVMEARPEARDALRTLLVDLFVAHLDTADRALAAFARERGGVAHAP